MPDVQLLRFLAVLLFLVLPAASYPQVQAAPAAGPASESEVPEEPRQIVGVSVKDNLLSVQLVNAEFGAVMKLIEQKTSIKADVGSDIARVKVSTKFSNQEIERGIMRIISLLKEKNFTFRYDEKGTIAGIEIYGNASAPPTASHKASKTRPQPARTPVQPVQTPAAAAPAPAAKTPVMMKPPAVQKNPPIPSRILPPVGQQNQQTSPEVPPSVTTPLPQKETPEPESPEVEVDEIPFPTPGASPGHR